MEQIDHDRFDDEKTCTYRGETYSVRDNGAVFRHRRDGARIRKWDEKWTFGRPREQDGYMFISSIQVHRIVATAFLGPEPSKTHEVDHKDTNRRNNRPENLRWVTRLEHRLLNPITARRIEIAYGSIENFLANPNRPLLGKLHQSYEWMRSVTKKQAEESYRRLLDWAERGGKPSGGTLGEWIYTSRTEQYVTGPEPDNLIESRTPRNEKYIEEPEPDDLIKSRTPSAIQKNWKTPSEFPLCPSDIGANALYEYRHRLKKGEVFASNDFGESKVVSAELSESSETLVVLCNISGVKDWSLAQVSVEDKLFVHESLGTFFTLEDATKQYVLERGLKWEGEDTIDDYC